MGFKRAQNPKDSLNIGAVHLAKEWLASMNIAYSEIEREEREGGDIFHVDVDGDVFLADFHINDINTIPEYINFRNVSGRFILGNSQQSSNTLKGTIIQNDLKDELGIGLVNLVKDWVTANDIP